VGVAFSSSEDDTGVSSGKPNTNQLRIIRSSKQYRDLLGPHTHAHIHTYTYTYNELTTNKYLDTGRIGKERKGSMELEHSRHLHYRRLVSSRHV
jgi:hypothetical protein